MVVRLVRGPSGDDPSTRPAPTGSDAPRSRSSATGSTAADSVPSTWLGDLLWTLGPVPPTPALRAGSAVTLRGPVGGVASGTCVVHNEQSAAISALLAPSPLVAANGFQWLPTPTSDAAVVVPAHGRRDVDVSVFVPNDLPPGTYRGSLVVLGTVGLDVELDIVVGHGNTDEVIR